MIRCLNQFNMFARFRLNRTTIFFTGSNRLRIAQLYHLSKNLFADPAYRQLQNHLNCSFITQALEVFNSICRSLLNSICLMSLRFSG